MGDEADPDYVEFTLADFRRDWITPAQATAAFAAHGVAHGQKSLLKRLSLGLHIAVAENAVMQVRDTAELYELFEIHRPAWASVNAGDEFWETGEFQAVMRPAPKPVDDMTIEQVYAAQAFQISTANDQTWDYVGVRFSARLIQSLMPTNRVIVVEAETNVPIGHQSASKQPLKSIVSQQELIDWARGFLPGQPAGMVFGTICAAAETHFAGRRITRDPLRAAIKAANYPVKRGNPSIRG